MKIIDLISNPAFFRGAVQPFVRMTPGLLDFYRQNENWLIRSNCPSGMQIVMCTDASAMEISLQFGKAAREVFTTDVQIGGKLLTFDGAGPHRLELSGAKQTVVIHLPHLVEIENFELKVNGAATVEAVSENRAKLLICGDSILQGMTCSSPGRASVALTAGELDMVLHNTSVGGAIMQPVPVQETLKLGKAGDIAIVGFGINDAAHLTDAELFRERTAKVLEHLAGFAGKAFIITPIPAAVDAEQNRELYSQMIRDEQKRFPQVTLIEGASFFPADASLFVDKLHPNDQGMQIYAQGLIKAIRE